jgi:hypothetical protein
VPPVEPVKAKVEAPGLRKRDKWAARYEKMKNPFG